MLLVLNLVATQIFSSPCLVYTLKISQVSVYLPLLKKLHQNIFCVD